jgi:hypothetical protein
MDPYLRNTRMYQKLSGTFNILAASTGAITLATCKTNQTIFLQKAHFEVTNGSASELWSLQDSAGSPIQLANNLSATTAGSHYDLDFGPEGIPLTQGTNLQLFIQGATGAIGWVAWEAYQKLTVAGAPSST